MATETQHTGNMPSYDPYALVDRFFMLFYQHTRQHARRLIRLFIALLPLMALLVGSCKVSELPWSYGSNAGSEQFRTALFPDKVNFQGDHYYPSAGYISRARNFVVGAPETLKMLTQQEISYLFGRPTLHRKDADAEVWQYKTSACVVDFYFYDKGSVQGQSALSYADIRHKEDMIAGAQPRTEPLSPQEQSACLHGVRA